MSESVEIDFVDALKRAWNIFVEAPGAYIGGFLLAQISMFLILTMPAALLGLYDAGLQGARKKEVTLGTCFSGYSRFFSSMGLFILIFLAVAVGLMLLVLPGLIAAVLFTWAFFFLIEDENCGPIDALGRSYELAKANIMSTLIALVLGFLLNVLGQATVVGWLITTPLSFILMGVVFDQLRAGGARDVTPQAA